MCTYCNPEECVWIRFEMRIFKYICLDIMEVFKYKQCCMQLQLEPMAQYGTWLSMQSTASVIKYMIYVPKLFRHKIGA